MDKPSLTVVPLKKEDEKKTEFTTTKILQKAIDKELDSALVIGIKETEQGREMWVTCSIDLEPPEINWLLDLAKNVNMAEYI